MTNKLINCIKKYYLKGEIEKVKIEVNDNTLKVPFISTSQDIVGDIIIEDINLDNGEFGVIDNSTLLNMLKLFDNENTTIKYSKKNNIISHLIVEDNEYSVEYVTANLMIIPEVPEFEEPEYDVTFDITDDFIDKFNKAFKVIDSEDVWFDTTKSKLKVSLGSNYSYSNKITLDIKEFEGTLPEKILFSAKSLNLILSENNDFTKGIIKICNEGLMTLIIDGEGWKSTYNLLSPAVIED